VQNRKVIITRNKQEVDALTALLADETELSYDTETSGLNPRKDTLIGFSVACQKFTAYVVLKAWQSSELQTILPYEDVSALLAVISSKRLIMWNSSFDYRFTVAQTGIDLLPALHADAMLALHTLDENRMSYGLKQVGKEVFGIGTGSEQDDMLESISGNGGTKKQYYMADSDILAKYGAQDAALTFDLWKRFEADLAKDEASLKLFEEEVMPLYKHVVIPAETRGIPVDVAGLSAALTAINQDIDSIETSVYIKIEPLLGHFNDWYIRTKYPFKLSGRFKELLGRELAPQGWPLTDKGVVSLSKVEIEKHKKKGLLAPDTHFERLINQQEHVPPTLTQKIQLQLMAEDGIKRPFNLYSTDHLKRLFFGTSTTPSLLKETPISTTDKGSPQINDEFLAVMARKYDWAALLQQLRGLQKIKGTYFEPILEGQENGIYYPSYFMHRTVSGRLSGNIQQLPRPIDDEAVAAGKSTLLEQKYTNMIRKFFIALPGHVLIDADYDSLEPRVFAHVSRDKGLIDIFKNGEDFYSKIAIGAEKLVQYSPDKKAANYLGKLNKPARQKAKAYSLGIAYGLGPYALSKTLNIPESEARDIYNGYLAAFPDLQKWMQDTETVLWQQGYITTELGRKRRFQREVEDYRRFGKKLFDGLELWKVYNHTPATYAHVKEVASRVKNARNNAYNFQIQGLAAGIINRASIAISKELKARNLDAYITMQVHDELLLHSSEAHKTEAAEILQRHMETTIALKLPLTATPSFGYNYAEAKG
jgi:DNA polymerase I-like protein with 3'-5' exonuclease and polymerase domains